jgi:predicted secreted Zn-dependent protease
VDTLEVEKEVLIAQLRRTEEEKVEAGENYQKLEEKLKFLSADLDCLRQQLEVVGKWASEKMEDFQEDLDVAKIIYSLHGSLSQVRISQHRE